MCGGNENGEEVGGLDFLNHCIHSVSVASGGSAGYFRTWSIISFRRRAATPVHQRALAAASRDDEA